MIAVRAGDGHRRHPRWRGGPAEWTDAGSRRRLPVPERLGHERRSGGPDRPREDTAVQSSGLSRPGRKAVGRARDDASAAELHDAELMRNVTHGRCMSSRAVRRTSRERARLRTSRARSPPASQHLLHHARGCVRAASAARAPGRSRRRSSPAASSSRRRSRTAAGRGTSRRQVRTVASPVAASRTACTARRRCTSPGSSGLFDRRRVGHDAHDRLLQRLALGEDLDGVAVALAHLLAVGAGHDRGLVEHRLAAAGTPRRKPWLKYPAMSRVISRCCTWSLPTGTTCDRTMRMSAAISTG